MSIVDAVLIVHGLSTVLLTAWVWALWRRPSRRDARVSALEDEVDVMQGTLRKLAGRIGKAQRDSAPPEPEHPAPSELSQRPGETYADWKARARALIAQGVKPAKVG